MGIFGNMNPRTASALQGIGLGLSQIDAGRSPNLSPIYAQIQEQDRQQQMQEAIGPALEGMNPGMRKVLASMPPALASQYIMKMMMPQAPQKGVVVNGRLVNPVTGDVIADYSSNGPEGWEQLSSEDVAALGLDANKVWQRGLSGANAGKITQVGGNGVNVSVSTGPGEQDRYLYGSDAGLPNGWRLDRQTGQASQIPGGPAAVEAAQAEEQADLAEKAKEVSQSIVLDEIGIAKELIAGETVLSPATGITGKAASVVDSTRAGALKNRLTTIKANIGFDKLQAMRDASPTGGALGQVSEFENRLLQAVFGSLEQAQGADDILYNLDRLENIYGRVVHEGIPDDEARELTRQITMGEFASEETPSIDFSSMPLNDLINVNVDTLTPDQQDALSSRLEELGY